MFREVILQGVFICFKAQVSHDEARLRVYELYVMSWKVWNSIVHQGTTLFLAMLEELICLAGLSAFQSFLSGFTVSFKVFPLSSRSSLSCKVK